MHPRTKIRRELAELLKAIGVPVYTSRARDLRRDDDEAIIIYVPDEELSRPIGDGEGRSGRPIQRDIAVEVLVMATEPGDGSEASDRCDELSRQVELLINASLSNIVPVSASQSLAEGAEIKCLTSLTYRTTYLDQMKMET